MASLLDSYLFCSRVNCTHFSVALASSRRTDRFLLKYFFDSVYNNTMKKSYDYLLFDWDGNIAKTLDIWLETLHVVLAKYGVTRSDHEYALSFGAWKRYAHEDWKIDFDTVLPELNEYGRRRLPGVELYPDALDVLAALHSNGKNIALISSSTHQNISIPLLKHDLMQYFDAIISADDITNHKPHPEPLEKALAKLGGTDKSRALMIGDSDKDLEAAKNFGCDSILFYPPEHKKFYKLNQLKKYRPTYIVDDFKKVLDIIL